DCVRVHPSRTARQRIGGGVMGEISKQQTAPSIDSLPSMKLLTFVLSLTAGSVDVIGFLGLGGLFTAHITGNLVILAAHVVSGETAPMSYLISVPVFMAAL